jgi:hypothetical protein
MTRYVRKNIKYQQITKYKIRYSKQNASFLKDSIKGIGQNSLEKYYLALSSRRSSK